MVDKIKIMDYNKDNKKQQRKKNRRTVQWEHD